MTRTGIAVVVVGVGLSVAAACGSDDPEAGIHTDPVLVQGGEVYEAECSSCHGDALQGTDKGPSHLSIVYEPNHHPDASFRSAILNGAPQHHWQFGDMPPVEAMTDAEIDAVIAYIRAEQQRVGFTR